jgi:hypothetical protein
MASPGSSKIYVLCNPSESGKKLWVGEALASLFREIDLFSESQNVLNGSFRSVLQEEFLNNYLSRGLFTPNMFFFAT